MPKDDDQEEKSDDGQQQEDKPEKDKPEEPAEGGEEKSEPAKEPEEEPGAPSEQESVKEPSEPPAEPTEKVESEQEAPKLTRKEKRAERKAFYDSIRKERQGYRPPTPQIPEYQPMDYNNPPADPETGEAGFDPAKLDEDRQKFAEYRAAQAAQQSAETERFIAEQDNFWKEMTMEGRLLQVDPQFKFLDEESDNFDSELRDEIHEMFFNTVGYTEIPATDQQGQAIVDPSTGQQITRRYVRDTGVSYEKFVKNYIKRLKRFAEDQSEQDTEKLVAAKSKQGVRPSGTKKGPKIETPEDLEALSKEEFEANKERIDRQAQKLFGSA